MSKVEFKTIPSPATARDGDAVRENYEDLSTASQAVTNENIQRGSVFTRHLSDGDGAFKTIISDTVGNTATDAPTGAVPLAADIPLSAPSSFATIPGTPVLAVANVPFAIANPAAVSKTAICSVEIQQQAAGAGPWITISRKDLSFFTEYRVATASQSNEQTSINLFGMFEATTIFHQVRLRAMGISLGVPYTQNYDFSGDTGAANYDTQLTIFVINN